MPAASRRADELVAGVTRLAVIGTHEHEQLVVTPRIQVEPVVQEVVQGSERSRSPSVAKPEHLAIEDPEEGHFRHADLKLAERAFQHGQVSARQRMLVECPEARDAEAADEMAAREAEHRVVVHRLDESGEVARPEMRGEQRGYGRHVDMVEGETADDPVERSELGVRLERAGDEPHVEAGRAAELGCTGRRSGAEIDARHVRPAGREPGGGDPRPAGEVEDAHAFERLHRVEHRGGEHVRACPVLRQALREARGVLVPERPLPSFPFGRVIHYSIVRSHLALTPVLVSISVRILPNAQGRETTGGGGGRLPDAARQDFTIRDYARLLLRRKWVVLATVLLVPSLAVGFALRQESLYQSSAKVLLKQGNLAATLSGVQDFSYWADPNRTAETQIELAQTPAIATRVLKAARVESRDPNSLLGSLSITPSPNADILNFTVTDRDPALARRLVNAYAREYTRYRRRLDTASLNQAVQDLSRRATELQASGQGAYARTLFGRAEQLRTLMAVENANAVVARSADVAVKVQPRPKRYGIIGLAFGLMLAFAFAFIRDALDTRVRSAEEIAHRLGIPLLARLPEPSKQLQKANAIAMLEKPFSVEAEAFRVLRTNLEFANIERQARSILITSALEAEGKSTTAANLAVAAALVGRRVVLVDLDLRRPFIDRFFRLQGKPGLTTVVLGHATLEDATARITIVAGERDGAPSEGNGHAPVAGVLDVLPSGPIPPNAGEFVGTGPVLRLLHELTHRYDLVIIDSPPLLHVGDALTLSSKVEGVVVVTRLPNVRRPILKELKRVLASAPNAKLGFVLAGADLEEGYGYGYYYSSPYASRQGEPSPERVT
jgi:succinoglycan biosynthesis transport protein ExoP